nr:hypothetical protein CFP56_68357 [Quercus suber]
MPRRDDKVDKEEILQHMAVCRASDRICALEANADTWTEGRSAVGSGSVMHASRQYRRERHREREELHPAPIISLGSVVLVWEDVRYRRDVLDSTSLSAGRQLQPCDNPKAPVEPGGSKEPAAWRHGPVTAVVVGIVQHRLYDDTTSDGPHGRSRGSQREAPEGEFPHRKVLAWALASRSGSGSGSGSQITQTRTANARPPIRDPQTMRNPSEPTSPLSLHRRSRPTLAIPAPGEPDP